LEFRELFELTLNFTLTKVTTKPKSSRFKGIVSPLFFFFLFFIDVDADSKLGVLDVYFWIAKIGVFFARESTGSQGEIVDNIRNASTMIPITEHHG